MLCYTQDSTFTDIYVYRHTNKYINNRTGVYMHVCLFIHTHTVNREIEIEIERKKDV